MSSPDSVSDRDSGSAGVIRSPDTERENRVPPGQHLVTDWPVLHHGKTQDIAPATWTFRIFGLVDEELTLDYAGFMALPRVKVLSDIHCVTTWSQLHNLWEGVAAEHVKELVRIKPEARTVMVHGAGDFTTNLLLDDFFQPDVLLAISHNETPISAAHGAPVRLVVPRLYFWKSAKWVTGIEFMDQDRPGFWESRGYHMRGDPWLEERYRE